MIQFLFCIVMIVFVVDLTNAFAYIDPGTGSVLLQSLIATISVGAAVLFGLRSRLALLWKRLFGGCESNKISNLQQKSDPDDSPEIVKDEK
jgi:UDP-N-acetylmuramyl pentapeptide phosphotransferase/UDP-N-acetylglucosamine-1-phosphate transferase